jgi:hypothetical protein
LKTPARGDFIFIHWDQIAMLLAHEREQCAQLFPQPHQEYFGRDIQDSIRARST